MTEATSPEKDARRQYAQYERIRQQHPDVIPYMGPSEILERFLSGQIVTAKDMLADQSLWVIKAIHHKQAERLGWMMRNAR